MQFQLKARVYDLKNLLVMASFLVLVACAGTPAIDGSAGEAATNPEVVEISHSRGEGAAPDTATSSTQASTQQTEKHIVTDLSSLGHLSDDELESARLDAESALNHSTSTVHAAVQDIDEKVSENKDQAQKQAKSKSLLRQKYQDKGPVNKGNAASRSLLKSSQSQLQKGQFRLATNSAERALRVSPRNPQAYYQLSVIYQKQKNYSQALHFAEKAMAQKGVGSSLRRKLWLIKADCYSALGDHDSADYAKKQAG